MKKLIFLIPTFLVFLLMTACNNQAEAPITEESVSEEAPAATLVALSSDQMQMADIETGYPEEYLMGGFIQCNGMAEIPPSNMQSVHSKTKGFVGPVEQIIGDYVRRGQVLTTISHPELVRLQRGYLETQAGLDALKKDFERKKQLASQDAASQKALEQAEADYNRALAQSKGLKAELELLGFSIQKLDEGQIQSRLNVYAPISGYIHEIGINPGKLVNEEDMLYQILDVEHMHLELQIFAKDLEQVKEGQRLEAMVPGTGKTFKGEVHRIGRMIDMEKKTALVHGHFDKDPADVYPGTYVQAKIYVEEETIEALPMTAIVRSGQKSFIFVEEPEGFQKVEIRLGRDDGQYAEVFIPDNKKGKKVVTKGAYYLNGMGE